MRPFKQHKSVETCVMVDIDEEVCDICREQLPEWNGGCFPHGGKPDPRLEVHYEDAKAFLEKVWIEFSRDASIS